MNMTPNIGQIAQTLTNHSLATTVPVIVNTTRSNPISEGHESKYQECSDVYTKMVVALGLGVILLGVVATVGNAITCLVIITNKSFHTVTYALLLSLGMSDLLLSCVLIPFDAGAYLTYEREIFVYSPFWVVIYNAVFVTLVSLSIMNLLLISMDRFITIRFPYSQYVTSSKKTMKIALICVWLYSLMLFLAMVFMQERPEEGEYDYLVPVWFQWFLLVLNWFLPTFLNVLIYLYILSVVLMQRKSIKKVTVRMRVYSKETSMEDTEHSLACSLSTRKTTEETNPSMQTDISQTKPSIIDTSVQIPPSRSFRKGNYLTSKHKVGVSNVKAKTSRIIKMKSNETRHNNRLFLWIGVCFLIFWLPHIAYQIFLLIKEYFMFTCIGDYLECLLVSFTYINNAVNVFVYGASSRKFRKAYKKLFRAVISKYKLSTCS